MMRSFCSSFSRAGLLLASIVLPNAQLSAQTTLEVQPGLTIPNWKTPWVLDSYNKQPQLVPLHHSLVSVNNHTGSNLAGATVGSFFYKPKITTELYGLHSRNVLHTSSPVIYLLLDTDQDDSGEGKSDDLMEFAIVRAVQKKGKRIIDRIQITQLTGNSRHVGDAVEVDITHLPNSWYRITPKISLADGEYALLPIPKKEYGMYSTMVWDFAVDGNAPNSKEAISASSAAK